MVMDETKYFLFSLLLGRPKTLVFDPLSFSHPDCRIPVENPARRIREGKGCGWRTNVNSGMEEALQNIVFREAAKMAPSFLSPVEICKASWEL